LFPNIWLIIVGWDGLGLVSYCLVIYYKREISYSSGIITVLRNRIGDLGILIIIVFFVNFGSWDLIFFNFFYQNLNLICMILILGAITKRAQVPFSAWLPIAIAAPTPVSSLVHSSTLVTAGVYLLLRFYNYFNGGEFSKILFFIGLFTIFMARLGALLEVDLKKIIALSTLRQLGLIFITISLGIWKLTFFHLIIHAVFKAMLFLCAGIFIHELQGRQDVRKLGSSGNINKRVKIIIFLRRISMIGFPFLGGFYSKDIIFEIFYNNELLLIVEFFLLVRIILTVLYSLRLIYYIFWRKILFLSINRFFNDKQLYKPIYFIGVIVIFIGRFVSWVIFSELEVFQLSIIVKNFNLICILFSFIIYLLFYLGYWYTITIKKIIGYVFLLFLHFISSRNVLIIFRFFRYFQSFIDQGWVERLGGQIGFKLILSVNYFIRLFLLILKIFFFYFYNFFCFNINLNNLIK